MSLQKDLKTRISILGTQYVIKRESEKENSKLEEADGLCEQYSKEIIIREDMNSGSMTLNNLKLYENKVLRHEIIHAFFMESGLSSNSDYAENEELVDWIAIQYPKLKKVFNKLGIEE